MKLRPLTLDDVTVAVEANEEDVPILGNAMASGDAKLDREVEEEVCARLRAVAGTDRSPWPWCVVTVTAAWKTWKGTAAMGCCSYDSEKEFVEGPYFDDLRDEALSDLNAALARCAAELTAIEVSP